MLTSKTTLVAVIVTALSVMHQALPANAEAISVKLGSGPVWSDYGITGVIGTSNAGVVDAGNWNDVTGAAQTNLALKNSSGATVSGFTLTQADYSANTTNADAGFGHYPGQRPDSADLAAQSWPGQQGNAELMMSNVYAAAPGSVSVTFSGTVPYNTFDLYVYSNSGYLTFANTQNISVLDVTGTTAVAGPQSTTQAGGVGVRNPATSFVLGDNYVKFSGLTSDQVTSGFVVKTVGMTGGFGYLSGVQVVGVPEPSAVAMLITGLLGLLAYAWRKRTICDIFTN